MMRFSVTTLGLILLSGAALAQPSPAAGGGPVVNDTVFSDAALRAVTAVTEVFGDSQNVTGAIVELAAPVKADSLKPGSLAVDGRTLLSSRVTASPDIAAPAADGRFVVMMLDPADAGSLVYDNNTEKAAQIAVSLTAAIPTIDGGTLEPGDKAVLNTRVHNLIVDDFRTFRFTDPETGLILDYNLFIPRGYDPAQDYPLVMFMHDAGVTGSNPRRTLQQGLGAVSFASPADQARHPSFVLAPQFPVPLANDAGQTSAYVDMLPRLLDELQREYAIDGSRLYTTGQSGGCMTSIALNISYPDLFAGTLCVAGQWDAAKTAPLTGANFWAIVSEDDAKAFPGMGAIMDGIEAQGTQVVRGQLDAKASADDMARAIAAIRAEAGAAHVFFTPFIAGSVLKDGSGGGAGHVRTWIYAYDIPAVRDWLFEQRR